MAARRIVIPISAYLPFHGRRVPLQRSRRFLAVASGVSVALMVGFLGARPADAATAPVGLGTAGSFAVLAGSTITNTGASLLTGDLGVSPGTAVTGFPPGLVVGGTIHRAGAVALKAKSDLTTAYNDAAGRPTTSAVTTDLGGSTLVPGVYTGPTLSLTGALTLNAKGDPNAVFVFQSASTLITASASRIVLINGASPCNVYFKVASSTTLGTNSVFVGTVLAHTSISAKTGATILGRLLASTGAVTLQDNRITRPLCSVPITPPPSSGTPTTSGSGTTGTSGGSGTPTTSGSGTTGTSVRSGTPSTSGGTRRRADVVSVAGPAVAVKTRARFTG